MGIEIALDGLRNTSDLDAKIEIALDGLRNTLFSFI